MSVSESNVSSYDKSKIRKVQGSHLILLRHTALVEITLDIQACLQKGQWAVRITQKDWED